VLLPTSSKKLLTQWQGPYCVLCGVGKVNYEVHTPGKKRKAACHINMLKKWHPPEGACHWMAEDVSSEA